MAFLDDLIGCWKLDEASGDAVDAHSNGLTLTAGASITTDTGKINGARKFAPGGGRLTRADEVLLSMGAAQAFTISAWIYFYSTRPTGITKLVVKDGGAQAREYALEFEGTDNGSRITFRGESQGGGVPFSFNSVETISEATWYHLLAGYDPVADQFSLAVNNGTPVTDSQTSGADDSDGSFKIGDAANLLVDEVSLWKRVLTSEERSQLYNGGNGLAYPFSVSVSNVNLHWLKSVRSVGLSIGSNNIGFGGR